MSKQEFEEYQAWRRKMLAGVHFQNPNPAPKPEDPGVKKLLLVTSSLLAKPVSYLPFDFSFPRLNLLEHKLVTSVVHSGML